MSMLYRDGSSPKFHCFTVDKVSDAVKIRWFIKDDQWQFSKSRTNFSLMDVDIPLIPSVFVDHRKDLL